MPELKRQFLGGQIFSHIDFTPIEPPSALLTWRRVAFNKNKSKEEI